MKEQHDRDSAELRKLCQERDRLKSINIELLKKLQNAEYELLDAGKKEAAKQVRKAIENERRAVEAEKAVAAKAKSDQLEAEWRKLQAQLDALPQAEKAAMVLHEALEFIEALPDHEIPVFLANRIRSVLGLPLKN